MYWSLGFGGSWFAVVLFEAVACWRLGMLTLPFVNEETNDSSFRLARPWSLELKRSVSNSSFGTTLFGDSCFPAYGEEECEAVSQPWLRGVQTSCSPPVVANAFRMVCGRWTALYIKRIEIRINFQNHRPLNLCRILDIGTWAKMKKSHR